MEELELVPDNLYLTSGVIRVNYLPVMGELDDYDHILWEAIPLFFF